MTDNSAPADQVQLHTEHCLLRPFRQADRERLAEIANDRRISRNLTDAFPYPYTLSDADDWIAETGRHDPPRHFAIEVDGVLAGGIGADPQTGEKRHVVAVGYWLAPSHWGRGYATEALAAMVEYVFVTFPGVQRLEASVYGWNPASGRVMEKCGFRKEATFRKRVIKDDEVTDEHIYRLLRQEVGQSPVFDTSPHDGVTGIDETPLYETFAEEYENHAAESPYNAYYDRPAVLELLGDVDGSRVLDVGCGPGFYAEELVARGADVVGFDASPKMVDLAGRRVGDGAEFRVHDLSQPLDWLEDETFDAAVAALVIHYVDNRREAFSEIYRVLKPGGHAVVSTHHPTLDWLRTGGSYFAEGIIEERWSRGWEMRYWRMPLSVVANEMTGAGFLIERLVEPTAVPELGEVDPEHFEELTTEPHFICFRLVKPEGEVR
ncbi:MAG: GNAT family N-acetyltransferase [Actinomycetota bacterium]